MSKLNTNISLTVKLSEECEFYASENKCNTLLLILGKPRGTGKEGTAFQCHMLYPLPSSACSAWTPVNEGTALQPLHQPWGPWLYSEQSKLLKPLFCSSVHLLQLWPNHRCSAPLPTPLSMVRMAMQGHHHWGWSPPNQPPAPAFLVGPVVEEHT